jgi:hypothetical protein
MNLHRQRPPTKGNQSQQLCVQRVMSAYHLEIMVEQFCETIVAGKQVVMTVAVASTTGTSLIISFHTCTWIVLSLSAAALNTH